LGKLAQAASQRSFFEEYTVISQPPASAKLVIAARVFKSHRTTTGVLVFEHPRRAWFVFGLIARPFGLQDIPTSYFLIRVSVVGSNWKTAF
jgi:hypothetical protein